MLYNYLKIAIRSIKKQRLFSFINVFGLSFSLAICLIIIMMLADQYSYDSFNTEGDQIYRVNHTRSEDQDSFISGMATSPMPLGEELMTNYTGVSSYARLCRGFGNGWVKLMQDVNIPISGFYADPSVLEMFQYELEMGDAKTALVEPYSVVLTKETAEKLFKSDNPIGEVFKVGDLGTYKVTGVLKELDGKSHIKFDGLASMSTVASLEKQELFSKTMENWRNRSRGWTYIKLENGVDTKEVEANLAKIGKIQYSEMDDMDASFFLQNMRKINPGPLMGNQIGPGIPMMFVYFLAGLALVIIISACFNYTNLSIARSMSRAREVGVRKIFGAVRSQIFVQFLMESIVISVLAFGFSLLLVEFLKPVFLELNFSQLLDWNLNQSFEVYLFCFAFALLVGIMAGVLPATFHSSVKAVQGLKNLAGVKVFSKLGMRKFLIVSQFSLSLFLIITVKLIYDQMNFMVDKEYGFNTDNNVVIRLNNTSYEKLKTELLTYSNVMSVTAASFAPAAGTSSDRTILIDNEEKVLNFFEVDEDYVENMGLEMVAGVDFSNNLRVDKLVINEKAIDYLGFESTHDALGKIILLNDTVSHEIIGVTKDYHHETLLSKISPMALIYDPDGFGIAQVRVNAANYEAAISDINAAWSVVNPSLQIEYKLMSDEISFFAELMFGDLTKIIAFISFLAIIIACLGMMGMVVFSTQVRLKEVSIRKVLGATNQMLVFILSKGFLKLLGIAILLTAPLSWFINNLWLDFIAFRVDVGADVILFGVFVVSLLGIIVVGSQTFRAANSNPAEILRDE